MRNAIRLQVLGLAVLTAVAGGCNVGAAPESIKADYAAVKIRHQADELRGRIWVLTRSGVVVFDVNSPSRIHRVPLPGWMWVGEPYGCLPGLALGAKGEAVISSDVVSTLWRVDPETFEVSEHALALNADTDRDIGFSALRYSRENNAFFGVSALYGSVWRIDPLLGRAQKVAHATPIARVCSSGETLGRGLPPEYAGR
jgi:hypothetical protein